MKVSLNFQPERMGGGSYVKTGKDEDESTTVIFCLPEGVGVLAEALKIFHVSYTYYMQANSTLTRFIFKE